MAKTGSVEAEAFAIVVSDHYILEGMFTFGTSVIRMRRSHSNSSAVFPTPFSSFFCVRFSLKIRTRSFGACTQSFVLFCFQ